MEMKKLIAAAAALAAAACTTAGPLEIETRDVVVTRTERPVTEAQVREAAPPAPLGPRPASLSATLDAALAKLCEYVRYAELADPLIQHAAGIAVTQRVAEPVCQGGAPPS
jgi:hypothetical protein